MEHLDMDAIPFWESLPAEIWDKIFQYLMLNKTRSLLLFGSASKYHQNFIVSYFTRANPWVGRNFNVAFIGSPDVGKSTTIAHLLLQSDPNKQELFNKHVENYNERRQNAIHGKDDPSSQKAWPDADEYCTWINEPFYGPNTVPTGNVSWFKLKNNIHSFTILDTPGCKRRLLSAYRICSQVNTIVLVFNKSKDREFKWLKNGVTAILTSLSHSHFIIAINYDKTELTHENFEEDRKYIGSALIKLVPEKILHNIKVIPIDALEGFNIYSPHAGVNEKNRWYTGPTLYRALHLIWQKLEYNFERADLPLLLPLFKHFRSPQLILTGFVNAGSVRPGMNLKICSPYIQNSTVLEVDAIEHFKNRMDSATTWDFIALSFKNNLGLQYFKLNRYLALLNRGVLIADANNPPKRVKSFIASIALVTNQAGRMKERTSYDMFYLSSVIKVKVDRFIDIKDKEKNVVNRNWILQGDSCIVECTPVRDRLPSHSELYMFPIQNKIDKNSNKKSNIETIMFCASNMIKAVGRINSIVFED